MPNFFPILLISWNDRVRCTLLVFSALMHRQSNLKLLQLGLNALFGGIRWPACSSHCARQRLLLAVDQCN